MGFKYEFNFEGVHFILILYGGDILLVVFPNPRTLLTKPLPLAALVAHSILKRMY